MKSIILLISNIAIPASVIIPVASTLNSYKNTVSPDDAAIKSYYASANYMCDDIKDNKSLKNWCENERTNLINSQGKRSQ